MNLPFLNIFKGSPKLSNKFLTVDINSENIKCLAYYVDEQQIAKIIGVGTALMEPNTVRGGNIIDMEQTKNALEEAVSQARNGYEDNINNVILGVNGNLSLGLMTTAKAARGQKGPVTQEELDDIEQTILNNAAIQARNVLLENTGNSDLDLETVTASTVYTKINGKEVKDPLKFEGESIETALFTAFTPSYHVKTLQKLAKNARLNILAIGSEMFSLVSALNNEPDYIIINIDSDFTDVGVVFGGGIVATKCLPIGAIHFTKEISQKMGVTLQEAEKMKNSYIYNKLSQSEVLLVQNCLHDTLNVWLDGLELLFSEFSGVKTFASKIYLVGEGSKLPDIFEFIGSEPWTKSIPFKSPPEFFKIRLDNLPKIADSTGKADVAEYLMPASLSSIFLEVTNDQTRA
jgi:cell division protein FtsA